MPYRIETDNPECREGYAVVKESDGELIFCHKTRREAKAQIAAIELSENYRALPQNYRPALSVDVPDGRNCKNCVYYAGGYCNLWSANVKASYYCNKWAGSSERADALAPVEERAEMYPTTEAMKAEARRGLEWRATFGRGGTPIGVASARDIIAGSVTYSRVLRIRSFLARHEIDKQGQGFRPSEDGYPSAGRIAWALWGGDPGQRWAENIVANIAEDPRSANTDPLHS
jgi:hypothetical protein